MILAIDTATRWTSIAIHDGRSVLAEHGWYGRNTQTQEVSPALQTLFRQASISVADLSAIAVAIGPGSYTGLRIGLGVAKGLALPHNIPLIGIGTLDVLVAGIPPTNTHLVAVIEAGRKRIIAGRYGWENGRWQAQDAKPQIVTWEELCSQIDTPTVVVGEISVDGAQLLRETTKNNAKLISPASSVRKASYLAELGWRRFRQKDVDDIKTLTPIYMREPDGA